MTHTRRAASTSFSLSPNKRLSILACDSPRSRRQSTAADTSRTRDNVFLEVLENNDEKEKKQRQLNRLQQQIQSKTFSPTAAAAAATHSDHRKSINIVSGLTAQQLTEHYSKCIQLSTENKINVNNAFKLQLIDYMSEMLHRRNSEMENFQVASCTLDASTKIYSCRVDSVHTGVLQMAGGLGRSKGKDGKEDEQADEQDGDERKEKKRKKRKKQIIESNLKNINVKGFDLDFQVDPLFKKMAAQFDEGRSTSGPFLTSLQFLDDSCALVLNSDTVLINSGKTKDCAVKEQQLVSIPQNEDPTERMICPTFGSFEFTSWKVGDEDSFSDISKLRDLEGDDDGSGTVVDQHKFDINAVPEPLDDGMDCDDYDANPMGGDEGDTVVTIGQEGCKKTQPPLMEAVHLKDHLAANPSEYSYFDSHHMCAWAGPAHWKIKPLSKTKLGVTKDDKKKKKDLIKLTYDKEETDDIDKLFAVTRKATKLSQATLKTWTKEKTTMPLDLHFEAKNFFKLFGRPDIIIQKQRKAAAVDESINEYNYDNDNDRENFCAEDENASAYGDASIPGYDVTDIFSETAVGSQPMSDMNKTSNFLGNLVAAPDKVEKINIGYARTAKKVDMKKLKTAIWDILAEPANEKENCKQFENQAEQSKKRKMDTQKDIDFSKLYKSLPQRLSSSMSGNISVPLVFIGLLHLANEYSLKLSDQGNLTDFTIMQG